MKFLKDARAISHFIVRLCVLAPVATLFGQPALRVYSEFQRVDPFGRVIESDRPAPGRASREILSPLVARNAYASFHVVVTAATDTPYELHVGQNPENAVRVTMYKEILEKQGERWIPDRLESVSLPYQGRVTGIPGQTAQAFWMDLWVEADAPVRRIKVEPQLWIDNRWIICPMEVRVGAVQVPRWILTQSQLAPLTAPADAAAWNVLAGYLCNVTVAATDRSMCIRDLIRRNAHQDVALLRAAGDSLKAEIEGLMSPCDAPPARGELGAESYLRVRDVLFRSARQP